MEKISLPFPPTEPHPQKMNLSPIHLVLTSIKISVLVKMTGYNFRVYVAQCNLGKVNFESTYGQQCSDWGGPTPLTGAPHDHYGTSIQAFFN